MTGTFFGPSLHWELEHFVEAGFSPIEAIRMATADAAEAVGAGDDLATIESGKLADLVLLKANPLENIRNTQTTWRVIKAGQMFDPQGLRGGGSRGRGEGRRPGTVRSICRGTMFMWAEPDNRIHSGIGRAEGLFSRSRDLILNPWRWLLIGWVWLAACGGAPVQGQSVVGSDTYLRLKAATRRRARHRHARPPLAVREAPRLDGDRPRPGDDPVWTLEE